MVHAYYSNGKGKTSAANGIALRALGSGMKVLYSQFMKNGDSMECAILKKLDNFTFLVSDTKYELFDSSDISKKQCYTNAYSSLLDNLNSIASDFDMIILDEILDCIYFDYVKKDTLTEFLKCNSNKEIILTGHGIDECVLSLCDYASKIEHIKHPYDKGISARKGIEY